MIKFKANSFAGDLINLAPNHEFREPTAILQMDNFTLVVDRGHQCIVQIDSLGNTTRTHSGTCAVAVGRTADGSFQEVKYKNPFDLASQNKDQTHLYVTNDGLLRLIDQENETVTTLYRAEWLLGRISFRDHQILIGGSQGILVLNGGEYTKQFVLQLNYTTTRHTHFGAKIIKLPYIMKSFAIISQNMLLVSRHQNDYSRDTSRLILIDMDTGVSSIVCGNNSQHTFCQGKLLSPGFILLANDTLYITAAPQRSTGFGATSSGTTTDTHNSISFQRMAIKGEFSITMSSFRPVE